MIMFLSTCMNYWACVSGFVSNKNQSLGFARGLLKWAGILEKTSMKLCILSGIAEPSKYARAKIASHEEPRVGASRAVIFARARFTYSTIPERKCHFILQFSPFLREIRDYLESNNEW